MQNILQTHSFMRMMQETYEVREKARPDEDDVASEEKILACMGILKTLEQLVVTLENSHDRLGQIELVILPVLEFSLGKNFSGRDYLKHPWPVQCHLTLMFQQRSMTRLLRLSIRSLTISARFHPRCGGYLNAFTRLSELTVSTTSKVC
jgi:hypothetical protein